MTGKSLFAIRLKSLRKNKGMTQEDLAGELDVTNITISRWENGENFPSEKYAPSLIKVLGFTSMELNEHRQRFELNKAGQLTYQPAGHKFVQANYPDFEAFLDDLIALDIQEMGLTPEQEGPANHWAPIFEMNPDTWKLVVRGDHVVGYWHYLLLTADAFRRAKFGSWKEAEVPQADLQGMWGSGDYHMFISHVVVDRAHRGLPVNVALGKSFVRHVRQLAKLGAFFEGFCTYAFTQDGHSLCKHFGMKPIEGRRSVDDEVIYYISGKDASKHGLLSQDRTVSRLYSEHFG